MATALVTGASGGIGFELAKLLARDRYDLVLVARDRERLRAAAKELHDKHRVKAYIIVKDLSRRGSADEIFAETEKLGLTVDVLVNNAGFGDYGPFAQSDWKKQEAMMEVDMVALTWLSRLYLPGMVERKRGRVLNVASAAAFQPGPLMAVYYASKAYVLSFSEAIGEELAGSGVTVTALCPGPTATGFEQAASLGESMLFKRGTMDAAEVARYGYVAMRRGDRVAVPGLKNKALAFIVRLTPRRLVTRIVKRMQGLRT